MPFCSCVVSDGPDEKLSHCEHLSFLYLNERRSGTQSQA